MARPLVLRPGSGDRAGYVTVDAEQPDLKIVETLVAEMQSDPAFRARGGLVPWAGPYDVLLAVTASVGAVAAAGGFVLNLFDRFAQKHPDTPIVINVDASTTVICDGREHPAHHYERVEELFAENRRLLDEPAPGGAGGFVEYGATELAPAPEQLEGD